MIAQIVYIMYSRIKLCHIIIATAIVNVSYVSKIIMTLYLTLTT